MNIGNLVRAHAERIRAKAPMTMLAVSPLSKGAGLSKNGLSKKGRSKKKAKHRERAARAFAGLPAPLQKAMLSDLRREVAVQQRKR